MNELLKFTLNNIYRSCEEFLKNTDEDIDIISEILYDIDDKDYIELNEIYMMIYNFCKRHRNDYDFDIDFEE